MYNDLKFTPSSDATCRPAPQQHGRQADVMFLRGTRGRIAPPKTPRPGTGPRRAPNRLRWWRTISRRPSSWSATTTWSKDQVALQKVIARSAAQLERGEWPVLPREPRHDDFTPIDFEFAEAVRTLGTLPTGLRKEMKDYHEIAEACMGLRDAGTGNDGRQFSPQTVEKLRVWATNRANGCDRLSREKVEMLLLALEILLMPGVEADGEKSNSDATRMMAVLGETTKVGSHSELSGYFKRFQGIASGRSSDPAFAGQHSGGRQYVPTAYRTPQAGPPETLLFYLRLAPGLSLKITDEVAEPAPPAEPPILSKAARPSSVARSEPR
ncbi:MAG: hypothetical protein WKF75_15550 [Singulisphaera sp.]